MRVVRYRDIVILWSFAFLMSGAAQAQVAGEVADSIARAFYRDRADEYAEESRAMRAARGRVTRKGGQLRITLPGGRNVTYTDTISDGDDHRHHLYQRYFPELHVHHVEVRYYEGGAHLLIHAITGEESVVPGPPMVSPNRLRFATSSVDLEALYDPNRLEIWRASKQGLQREFALDGEDTWGPDSVRWLSNTVIRYTRVSLSPSSAERVGVRRWVIRKGRQWLVTDRVPRI
jgi:hypothetical protein